MWWNVESTERFCLFDIHGNKGTLELLMVWQCCCKWGNFQSQNTYTEDRR